MRNIVVIGAQWGDEGKGKIVDWLSARADVVVRFQGGHNAGHTLVVDGTVYKLSLLPSGLVRGKFSVIGNGVVVDPWALLDEIARLTVQGLNVTPDQLLLSDRACLILPFHRDLDSGREAAAGAGKIGTTRRGIGPAYEDKVGRRAIRIIDLADPAILELKIGRLLAHHNALRRGLDLAEIDATGLLRDLLAIAPQILAFAGAAGQILEARMQAGARILFEGAQGTGLDVDHGSYPFVTSSNTLAGQAAAGSGLGPDSLHYVLGVAKAYATRVGEGPFPTELSDATGALIGERGHEFGTVTGRARRCGWIDLVALRDACRLNGVSGLAITKLDVLDGLPEIRLCTAYRVDGEMLDHVPAGMRALAACEPVYETLPGWPAPTRGLRRLEDLPEAARALLDRIATLAGRPIALVSTSPERLDVIETAQFAAR